MPVFVDVDEPGPLDPEQTEQILRAHGNIHYMAPVQLLGQAIDLDHLKSLVRLSSRLLRTVLKPLGSL